MAKEQRLPKVKKALAVSAEFATGESTPEWRGLMAQLLSIPLADSNAEVELDHDLSPSARDEDLE